MTNSTNIHLYIEYLQSGISSLTKQLVNVEIIIKKYPKMHFECKTSVQSSLRTQRWGWNVKHLHSAQYTEVGLQLV